MTFEEIVADITRIGYEHHKDTIVSNSVANIPHIRHTIRDIKPDRRRCLIVSAGPSLYRRQIIRRLKASRFSGTVIATDGAFVQCLRVGLRPDYVITLDPHPTRMVRWFGDPDLESNLNGDDYFSRQDLDVDFRSNAARVNEDNIVLVDRARSKLVICSTAPANVVARTKHLERYWFAPLVDRTDIDGLTRKIVKATKLPAMNTGGTVGNAAWVFAHSILKSPEIACVGMDFGYYYDTPIEQTQSFHTSEGREDFYTFITNPDGQKFKTDATYYWYRSNLLSLLKASGGKLTNCSEAGILFGENVHWSTLDAWLAS